MSALYGGGGDIHLLGDCGCAEGGDVDGDERDDVGCVDFCGGESWSDGEGDEGVVCAAVWGG